METWLPRFTRAIVNGSIGWVLPGLVGGALAGWLGWWAFLAAPTLWLVWAGTVYLPRRLAIPVWLSVLLFWAAWCALFGVAVLVLAGCAAYFWTQATGHFPPDGAGFAWASRILLDPVWPAMLTGVGLGGLGVIDANRSARSQSPPSPVP